jgi:hypothetical protein
LVPKQVTPPLAGGAFGAVLLGERLAPVFGLGALLCLF